MTRWTGPARRRAVALVAAVVVLSAVALVAAPKADAASTYLTTTFHLNDGSGLTSPLTGVGFENVTNLGNNTFTARPAIPSGVTAIDEQYVGHIDSYYQFAYPTGMTGTLDAAAHTATYDLGLTLAANAGTADGGSHYHYLLAMHLAGSYDPATGRVDLTDSFVVPSTRDRLCGCGDEDQYWILDEFYAGAATARFQFTIPPPAVGPTTTTTTAPGPVPGPVGAVTATPRNASALLQWAKPTTGGGQIIDYTVTCDGCGAPAQTSTVGSLTFTGLTNGVPVRFRVSARNVNGSGTPSPLTDPVTPGLPAAPTLVNVVPQEGAVKVQWYPATVPSDAPVTAHRITTFVDGVALDTRTFNTSTNADVISGLTNGRAYTFKIAAVNRFGVGLLSAATAPVTLGLPLPPTYVAAVRSGQSATVSWTEPAPNGGPNTAYQIRATSTSAVLRTVPAPATSAVIDGLTNGSGYSFTVTTVNANGVSITSSGSNYVYVGTPSAPILLSALPGSGYSGATVSGSGRAFVTWWPTVSTYGYSIQSVIITPYIGGVAQPAQTAIGGTNARVLAGLTNGTAYTFRVQVVTQGGTSPQSSPTAPIIVGSPTPPAAAPTVTAGVKQATVSWGAARDNDSAISSYVVTPYRNGVGQAAITVAPAALSTVATGLTTGASYTFTVAGVNARGQGPGSAKSAAVTIG